MSNEIVGQPNDFYKYLSSWKNVITKGLPKDIDFNTVLNFAYSCLTGNEQTALRLRECSRESFIKALIESASIGLIPNTPLDHAHLIPFGKEVKLIPGYKGLIHLAYNSGHINFVDYDVVYPEDEFEYQKGTNPNIVHVSKMGSKKRTPENLLYAYCVIRVMHSSYPLIDCMDREDINKIKERVTYKKGCWSTDEIEMWKKSVIKRNLKKAPKSPKMMQLARAIELDNQAETGEKQIFNNNIGGLDESDKMPSDNPVDEQ